MVDLTSISQPEGALLDVIFLHGLDGDAQKTWSNGAWPGWLGWLAEDIPEAAICAVGYGARSSRWRRGTALPIVDRATNLLAAFENWGIGRRPVCFVVHSMGGLILKEMLIDSAEGGINPGLAAATRAVVFLATPHNGSQLAVIADRFRRVYRATETIIDLKRDDAHLRRASSRYREWAADSRAEHLVLFETVDRKGVRVVDEGSSDPGILGVRPIPVDADHSQICKPDSRESLVYGQVRGLLRRTIVIVKLESEMTPQLNTDRLPASDSSRGATQGPFPLLQVRTEGAYGRSIEIQAFDRETVTMVARALRLVDSSGGDSND